MLRITKASEPIMVERLNICIYGAPGVRKSTLAFTASNPLLLDADEGAYRAYGRKDIVPVQNWTDISDIQKEDLEPYSTVILDTAGRALDKLTVAIIKSNSKLGNGGALTLQGFGALKAKFISWMKMVNEFGKDVVMISHMDEQRRGDDLIERLDMQGASKTEIYKSSDAMGKLYVDGKGYKLDFSPRENAYGKNPGGFDILDVPWPMPPDFLAKIIQEIKDRLNFFSIEQKALQDQIAEWTKRVEAAEVADDFNVHIDPATKAGTAFKMLLHTAAVKKGFTFDRKIGLYAPKVMPKKEEVFS